MGDPGTIFFVLRGGCPWRMLPEHFPPHQTTYAWFARFRDDGTWQTVNHHLLMLDSLPTPDFQALAEAFRDGL